MTYAINFWRWLLCTFAGRHVPLNPNTRSSMAGKPVTCCRTCRRLIVKSNGKWSELFD